MKKSVAFKTNIHKTGIQAWHELLDLCNVDVAY